MPRKVALIIAAFALNAFGAEEWELCPGLRLKAPRHLSFQRTEEVLMCGDPETDAWKRVPRAQAIFHLKTFLQDRGFYFATLDESPSRALVDVGKEARVVKMEAPGAPASFDLSRFWGIVGEILTPTLLQETEKRFLRELRLLGHACPKVKVEGFPATGVIRVEMTPGPVGIIRSVSIAPIEGVKSGSLYRHHAFFPGARFDGDALTLTTQRIHESGIVQNTLFDEKCEGAAVDVHETSTAGPPRIVTLGIGLNTEKGLAAKASWAHARVGDNASPIEIAFTGYYGGRRRNEQQLSASAKWYYRDAPSRFHLRPGLLFRHESQANYDLVSGKIQLLPAFTWDGQYAGGTLTAGPALNGVHTFRGEGRQQAFFLSFGADVALTSHDFELYRNTPRTGYQFTLGGSFSKKSFLADLTAQTVRASFHRLWNIGGFDPALWILGVRGSFAMTVSPSEERSLLPPNLRHFLGGSSDLRGFGLLEAPSAQGALTAAFLSTELRVGHWLPWGLEPLVFFDLGKTGSRPAALDQPWLYSPGAGLRWESPIGAFRVSLAHGFLGGTPPPGYGAKSHFQFFVSFGEEF